MQIFIVEEVCDSNIYIIFKNNNLDLLIKNS